MNQEQAKKLLSIIQAISEGKTIQVRDMWMLSTGWKDSHDTPLLDLTSPQYDWRVKPEVKEGWINIYPTAYGEQVSSPLHKTKDSADRNQDTTAKRIACIKITWTEGEGI